MRLHAEKAGLNGAAVKRTCFAACSFGTQWPLKGRCAKRRE